MRFIVDFYRYAVLAMIALLIIGAVFVMLSVGSRDLLGEGASPYFTLAMIGLVSLLVMSLGGIATFISMHDRHAELVAEISQIRGLLEQRENA